jgi:cell division protein FtsZ
MYFNEERRSSLIELDTSIENGAKIKIVGVGGGGNNAINSMIGKGLVGVDFIAINTDAQVLGKNKAQTKIQIGKNLTRGLGAGADPTVGLRAAEEDREEISAALSGSDMVFVTTGMGGGTGTGASPIVANIAKNLGALVVGIVTKPFHSEGKKRMAYAEEGIIEMKKYVDTLIVVPNQKLLSIIDPRASVMDSFEFSNQILHNASRGISDLITVSGIINVDFADVRKIMRDMGDALMGTGIAKGEHRATEAAAAAISHPLMDGISIAGAQGVLINITGGKSLSLKELDEGAQLISEQAGEDAEIILGYVIDEKFEDEMMVTVIATGFGKKKAAQQPVQQQPRKLIDRFSDRPLDLQKLDEPAFVRRGVEINPRSPRHDSPEKPGEHSDVDRPAFLRKIMD